MLKHFNKYCLILLLLCLPCFVLGQQTQQRHAFIQYDSNFVRYDTLSPSLKQLALRWTQAEAGRGSLSIVHMGGSHVQAGTLPHRVRCNLLQRYPERVGGRGLIFPYSAAAKCNNPADYRVHCKEKVGLTRNVYKEPEHDMGLCGIAITAHDTLTTVQMVLNAPQFDFATSRISILGESPEGIEPQLRARPRYIDNMEGATFNATRYDAKHHRWIFDFRFETDSFDIILPCDSAQTFTLRGVLLERKQPGMVYHSIGVNGAAVPDYLKCRYLTEDLRLVHPDLVVFGIGINDAAAPDFDTLTFKNNYLALCDSIRSVTPRCAFIFITNNDSFKKVSRKSYKVNKNGLLVREVCYRLAQETGGAVWDQFEIMGGLSSMDKWRIAKLAKTDRVHFTRAGYELVGDLFSQALFDFMEKLKTSK